jgi:hypothetical protein
VAQGDDAPKHCKLGSVHGDRGLPLVSQKATSALAGIEVSWWITAATSGRWRQLPDATLIEQHPGPTVARRPDQFPAEPILLTVPVD